MDDSMQLKASDLAHLKMVAWSIVKRTSNRGWHCADDPTAKVDGRTLLRLARLGLIEGLSLGTTFRNARVQVELTKEGERVFETLRKQCRV